MTSVRVIAVSSATSGTASMPSVRNEGALRLHTAAVAGTYLENAIGPEANGVIAVSSATVSMEYTPEGMVPGCRARLSVVYFECIYHR